MSFRLLRRGIDHGRVTPGVRATSWSAGEPEVLRPATRPGAGVAPGLRLIEELRRGRDLVELLPAPPGFRFAGVSQNTADPLELHKLHVVSRRTPRELYVKTNWLSTWPGDGSLRLRFSYGREILDDWLDDPVAAGATLALCEGLLPATRLVTRNAALRRRLQGIVGSAPRFIQPIVYANAPGGGALFHHDAVPGQAGVLYTQLAGRTAWLAVPEHVLSRHARGRLKSERLLNSTPSFTRRLAEDGWMFVLGPGDAILLPCAPKRNAAWHSVFTLGKGGNLALSMGFTSARKR